MAEILRQSEEQFFESPVVLIYACSNNHTEMLGQKWGEPIIPQGLCGSCNSIAVVERIWVQDSEGNVEQLFGPTIIDQLPREPRT